MRIAPIFLLLCGCSTEVVTAPAPSCDDPILAGPVTSDVALQIAGCLVGDDTELLAIEGRGGGASAAEGRLSTWDVVVLGQGVIHGVGLAAGLEAGTAEYSPEELFGEATCDDLLPAPAHSAALLPHALAAGLGPLGEGQLAYRIASDCLAGGTSRRIVVKNAGDRLLYTVEGQLSEECFGCLPDDSRPCCAL